jgi:prepilin-type N-terminal cleavage/methylation domain-containing protein
MKSKKAFTLLEVLISIGLLGLILPALFAAIEGLRKSNDHLKHYLYDAQEISRGVEVLYNDIASSDGNFTIKKDEYTRLCIQNSGNSLYGLSESKVCWLVLKSKNTLIRVEGWDYRLPTRSEENVEIDRIMENTEIFDLYHKKDKVMVILKEKNRKAISFLVQGITKPVPPKKKKKPNNPNNPANNPANPQQPGGVPGGTPPPNPNSNEEGTIEEE